MTCFVIGRGGEGGVLDVFCRFFVDLWRVSIFGLNSSNIYFLRHFLFFLVPVGYLFPRDFRVGSFLPRVDPSATVPNSHTRNTRI